MGHDQLPKEEVGGILYQQVHVVATTQDIHHSTQIFVRLTRDYLSREGPLFQAMATWPCNIERLDTQYDKVFAEDHISGAYIVDRIHKRGKVFLHYSNTTSLEDVDTGALEEF